MSWSKLFHALLPPKADDDPHPWRVSVFFWLIMLIGLTMFSFLADYGRLTWVGIQPSIRSDQVDTRILEATRPLNEKVASTDRMTRALLRNAFRPQIEAKVRERCDTNDRQQRSRINSELGRIKWEYKQLSGEEFGPDPDCHEV